jgi:hypothetical protein
VADPRHQPTAAKPTRLAVVIPRFPRDGGRLALAVTRLLRRDMMEQGGRADFVAFLESEDIRIPAHLADALASLRMDDDFYRCDNSRDGAFRRFSEAVAALNNPGWSHISAASYCSRKSRCGCRR